MTKYKIEIECSEDTVKKLYTNTNIAILKTNGVTVLKFEKVT